MSIPPATSNNHSCTGLKEWAILLLCVLLVVGGMFRFYKLGEKSLWSDELATIATSMGNSIDPDAYTLQGKAFDPPHPVSAERYREKATQSHGNGNFQQTADVLKANVHPPLFFWLMNLWVHATGLKPGTLRIPAVLFGLLSIALMAGLSLRIARLNGDSFTTAQRQTFVILATSFMALSAYQVDHAQDARQYTLLTCLALGAVWLSIDIVKQSGSQWMRWIALSGILAAGLYCQYFFVVFTGFVFAYLLWQAKTNRRLIPGLLVCIVLIALMFSPWLPYFKAQLHFLKTAGHYTSGLWKPIQLPEKLWRIACEFFLPESPLGKALPAIILISGLGTFWWKQREASDDPFRLSPAMRLIAFWLIALIGGQVVLDIIKQSHTATIRRYLLLASPACYLLMAYTLSMLPQYWKNGWAKGLQFGLSALLISLMSLDTVNGLLHIHTSSDEYRQAAAWINSQARPDDLILVNKTGAMAVGMGYYLKPHMPILGIDVRDYSDLDDETLLMQRLSESLPHKAQSQVWLIFSHSRPSTRYRLTEWLTQAGYEEQEMRRFPGIRAMRWTFSSPLAQQ